MKQDNEPLDYTQQADQSTLKHLRFHLTATQNPLETTKNDVYVNYFTQNNYEDVPS